MLHSTAFPSSFSTAMVADALGITRQAVSQRAVARKWASVPRKGQGGGKLWQFHSMDERTQHSVLRHYDKEHRQEELAQRLSKKAEMLFQRYLASTDKARQRAKERYDILMQVMDLYDGGMHITTAIHTVSANIQKNEGTIRHWYYGFGHRHDPDKKTGVRDLPRNLWLYALVDTYKGRTATASFSDMAWEYFKALYFTARKPDLSDAYRRTVEAARLHGWDFPSEQTVRRRVRKEIPQHQIKFLHGNKEAIRNVMPAQERDHTCFASGEAVNGDGVRIGLWTAFEDGECVEKPVAWFWQDIRSSKLLSWCLDKTENTNSIRLSLYDLLGQVLPAHIWSDNTTAASNKLIAGRAANRHRFTNKPTDGPGLPEICGIEYHFTNPNHEMSSPGSKPIERAFGIGGIRDMIINSPRLRGLGSMKKPVPVALLREVIAEEMARYNAIDGRRGRGMNNKSFNQVFEENFHPTQPLLSQAMRDLFLMDAETVTVSKDGKIRINAGRGEEKNAYWSEVSTAHAGERVVVRFHPEDLTRDVHIFDLDGRLLGSAQHNPSVAFKDKETGKVYNRTRGALQSAEKAAARAQVTLTNLEVQQYTGRVEHAPPVTPRRVITKMGSVDVHNMMREMRSKTRDESLANMKRTLEAV